MLTLLCFVLYNNAQEIFSLHSLLTNIPITLMNSFFIFRDKNYSSWQEPDSKPKTAETSFGTLSNFSKVASFRSENSSWNETADN